VRAVNSVGFHIPASGNDGFCRVSDGGPAVMLRLNIPSRAIDTRAIPMWWISRRASRGAIDPSGIVHHARTGEAGFTVMAAPAVTPL